MKIEELENYQELIDTGLMENQYLPLPEVSRCFVARDDDGKIVGYVFIQTLVTIEPIWIDPEERSSSLALKLFGHAASELERSGSARYFITHADTPKISEYLTRIGMEKLNWETFKMDLVRG